MWVREQPVRVLARLLSVQECRALQAVLQRWVRGQPVRVLARLLSVQECRALQAVLQRGRVLPALKRRASKVAQLVRA